MSASSTPPAQTGDKQKRTSILDRAQVASDVSVITKLLLAGDHGAGKTHCMATAPGLFAAVFEGNQSKSTIRSANPGATIFEVQNLSDWRELYAAITGGELGGFQFFGVDSLNEMQAYYDRDLDNPARKKEAQTASGKENKWAKFRAMKTAMGNIFVFLRDMPLPVAATIRTKTDVEEETGIQRVRFSLEGDAKNNVGAYFTATAYIYKYDMGSAGQARRAAMFTGPENFPCREMEILKGICEPNIKLWVDALAANAAGRELPSGLYIPDARMPGERASRAAKVEF